MTRTSSAVSRIEFEADQIIAGLAVWLVALGLAPFARGGLRCCS